MRFTLWLVLVVACGSSAAPPASDPPPAIPARAPAPPARTPAPPPPAAVPLVDLLHQPGATLAVSSVVGEPDITHDLVDGDLATAWRSRSGDLEDTWIAFRVPESAHVTRIRMTAGFTASGPEGDYFT